MKKLLIVLALTASLGGCATIKNLETAVSIGTASIANPVTPTRLYQLENTIEVVFAGLQAWKASCVQGVIPPVCKQQIASVQVYTRQIPPYLINLRKFVKSNDQVNATVIFNSVMDIVSAVKTQAAVSGQNIGS